MLLHEKIRDAYVHPQFIADVIKPLQIEQIMDQEVSRVCTLQGGGGDRKRYFVNYGVKGKDDLGLLIVSWGQLGPVRTAPWPK